MTDGLERATCPICGSAAQDPTPYSAGDVAVVRCTPCGALYLSPRLSEREILSYYQSEDYFEGGRLGYTSYAAQEQALRLTFRRLLSNLSTRGATGGTLLEVGCGFGYLLDEASPYFDRRYGTDMSEGGAREARMRADNVWIGGIDSVPAGIQVDTAIAVHVIEHIYDPRAFVSDLLRLIRPGGHLLLAAPDAGSLWFKLLGKRWPSFKFPEHVTFFDHRSLSALLKACGLVNLHRMPYPHAFPWAEVAAKVGAPTLRFLKSRSAWIPGTTVSVLARAPVEGEH